jgi:pimeloyl-ACP methyl ester carboxylesterase
MPLVDAGDHQLFYERSGAGEPLLLIMGMSGTRLTWGEPFLEALRADFDTVVFDNRGVGDSPGPTSRFTLADLADDATAIMDALGWENAHVVGISMGGMIAQELALRHPDRVRTLVLGCTYAGGAGSALTTPEVAGPLFEAMTSGDAERAIRAGWEANVSAGFAARDDQWRTFHDNALKLRAPLPVIQLQLQAIAGHDTSARLRDVSAPTLVVHGTEDAMLPVANAKAIADAIPGARLEILDGIGHLFFWEEPERSAALVREHALVNA